MASSRNVRQPVLEPALASKLTAKFGKALLSDGFTGIPVLVQRYYRSVPGNPRYEYEYAYHPFYRTWMRDEGTRREVCTESYMTPTEFAIMCDIWSYWWYEESQPWPAIGEIASHVGKSERQVRRYLHRMQESGWMLVVTQYNAEGKQVSNRYDFSPFLRRLVAYLESIGVLEKPVQVGGEGVISTLERVSERPPRRVSRPPESDESSPDLFEEKESIFRDGGAAAEKGTEEPVPLSACSHIAHAAIRNTNLEEKRNTSKPENIEQQNNCVDHPKIIESIEGKRNCPPGAGKRRRTAENRGKLLNFEEQVARAGIAPEALEEMLTWLRANGRPEVISPRVQEKITQWSGELGNAEPNLMAANLTQASKLCHYARLRGLGQQATENCLERAREAVRHHPHARKPMAFFFTSLKLAILLALKPGQDVPATRSALDGDPGLAQVARLGPPARKVSYVDLMAMSNEARQAFVEEQRARADQQYTDLGLERDALMALEPEARIALVKQQRARQLLQRQQQENEEEGVQ